eukprot:2538621-Prorocentrum_lima.AAC.1
MCLHLPPGHPLHHSLHEHATTPAPPGAPPALLEMIWERHCRANAATTIASHHPGRQHLK